MHQVSHAASHTLLHRHIPFSLAALLPNKQHQNTAHFHNNRRLEYRPHDIAWSEVEAEALTGKTFVSPYPDREGRPVVIMRPR